MTDLNKIQELMKNIVEVKSDNNFNLAKHQKEATDKIIKLCRFQKGLLLWHTMGSGKTITGWNIANNLPIKDSQGNEHKRIIIGPEGLDISWRNDGKFIGIIDETNTNNLNALYTGLTVKTTRDTSNIPPNKLRYLNNGTVKYTDPIYYSYSDIKNINRELLENMKNSIIICDEAHNLVKVLKDLLNSPFDEDKLKAKRFISSLDGVFKIILSTGTPINTDSKSQIAPLINIVAGKYVIPATDIEITQLLIPNTEHLKIQKSVLTKQIEQARIKQDRDNLLAEERRNNQHMLTSIGNWISMIGPGISNKIKVARNIIGNSLPKTKRHYAEIVFIAGITLLVSGTVVSGVGITGDVGTGIVRGITGATTLIGGPIVINIDKKSTTVKRNNIDTMATQSISDIDRLDFIKRQINDMQNNVDEDKFAKMISPYISFYDYKVNGVYTDLWKFPHSSNELIVLNPNNFMLEDTGIDNIFITDQELANIERDMQLYRDYKYRWRYGAMGAIMTTISAGIVLLVVGVGALPPLLGFKGAGAVGVLSTLLGYKLTIGSNLTEVEEATKEIHKYTKFKKRSRDVITKVDISFSENITNVNNNINNYLKSYNKSHIPWTQYQLYLFYKYISRDFSIKVGVDLNLTINEATLLDKIDILADNIGIDKTGISASKKNVNDEGEDNYLKYNFTRIIGNISYDLEYFGTILAFPGKSGNKVFIPIPTKNALTELIILNNTYTNYFTKMLTTPTYGRELRKINIKNIQISGYGYKNYKINLVDDKYLFTDDIELSTFQINKILSIIKKDNDRLNLFLSQIEDDYNIDYSHIIPIDNVTKFCHISPFYCEEDGDMKHRKKLLEWIKEYKNIIIRSKIQFYCIPTENGIYGKGTEIENLADRLSIHQKNLLKTVNNINTFNIFGNNKFIDLVNNLTNSECSPEINVSRENNFYLPTVYSNFEHYGFELSSAFLTYKGLNHIVFHNIMDDKVKSNLSSLSKIPFITMSHKTAKIKEITENPELNKKYIDTYKNDSKNEFLGISRNGSIEMDENYSPIIKFTNKVRCIVAESVDKDIANNLLKKMTRREPNCQKYNNQQENCNKAKGCRYINETNEHVRKDECVSRDTLGAQEDINRFGNDNELNIDQDGSYLISGTIDTYDDVIFEFFVKDDNINEEIINKLGLNRLNLYKGFDINYDDSQLEPVVERIDDPRLPEHIFKIKKKTQTNIKYLDNSEFYHNTPVCVLLHNKLTEGIDLPMSPAIHVLEMPDNYGKAGQIYARILRNISSKKPYNLHHMITGYMEQAQLLESMRGLVKNPQSQLITNESIVRTITELRNDNNRIIENNRGYLTLEEKTLIESNREKIINLNKLYGFIYKSVKTIEQCNPINIGGKIYNDTYKKYKLIDYCCDKFIDNGEIVNKKNKYKLDDYCNIYISYDEDEKCKIKDDIDVSTIKKFNTTLKKIENSTEELKDLVKNMTDTDNIILNVESNNIVLEVQLDKYQILTLFDGDLDLGETAYNPNINPINRCMKKVYQYCMSYKENENYLLSNYELRQRRLVTLYLNNESNGNELDISQEELDILLAYINKMYPKTTNNQIQGPDVNDYYNMEAIRKDTQYKDTISNIQSKKGFWKRHNRLITQLESTIVSLKSVYTAYKIELKKWTQENQIIYLVETEEEKKKNYTFLYGLWDKTLTMESRGGRRDVIKSYPKAEKELYNFKLNSISQQLRQLIDSAGNSTDLFHTYVFDRIITGKSSFDADFMINFAMNIIEDTKINSSWSINMPSFNIQTRFTGGFLKGRKLSTVMPFDERKKQFLNSGKVLKEEHNEIKNEIMEDIIYSNHTNIQWEIVLAEFILRGEDISNIKVLTKAFSKYYNKYMNEKKLYQYLDAETTIIEQKINNQRIFFEKLQNNLISSDQTKCGAGTIEPIDLSMDNLVIIKQDENKILLKFKRHIPNIQTTLNNTINILGLRNNGLHNLNTKNGKNVYQVLKYDNINYELSLQIQNKNTELDRFIRNWRVREEKSDNFITDAEEYFGNFENLKRYLCSNDTDYNSQTIEELDENIQENNNFIDRLYKSLLVIKTTIQTQYVNDFNNDYKLMEKIHNEFLTWRWTYDKTIFTKGFYYLFEHFDEMKSAIYHKLTSLSLKEKKILMFIDLCLSTISPYKVAIGSNNIVNQCTSTTNYTEKSIQQNVIHNQSYRKDLYNQLQNLNKELNDYKMSFSSNINTCVDTLDHECNYNYECVDITRFNSDKGYRESIKNQNFSLCKQNSKNTTNTNSIIYNTIESLWDTEQMKEQPIEVSIGNFISGFEQRSIKLFNSNNKRNNYVKYHDVINTLITQLSKYTVDFSMKFEIECNEWKYNKETSRIILEDTPANTAGNYCINKQIGGGIKTVLDVDDLDNFISKAIRNHHLLNNNYDFDEILNKLNNQLKEHYIFNESDFYKIGMNITNELLNSSDENKFESIPGVLDGVKLDFFYVNKIGIKTILTDIVPIENTNFDINIYLWLFGKQYINVHNKQAGNLITDDSIVNSNIDIFRYMIRSMKEARDYIPHSKIDKYKSSFDIDKERIYEYINWWSSNYESETSYRYLSDETKKYITDVLSGNGFNDEEELCYIPVSLGIFIQNSDVPMYSIDITMDDFDFINGLFKIKNIPIKHLVDSKYVFRLYRTDLEQNISFSKHVNLNYHFYSNNYLSSDTNQLSCYSIVPVFKCLEFPNSVFAFTDTREELKFILNGIEVTTKLLKVRNIGNTIYNGNIENIYNLGNFLQDEKLLVDVEDEFIKIMIEDTSYRKI